MTLASASIAESSILEEGAGAALFSSVGVMAPLSAYGTQGSHEFRGESYRATETQWRFQARDGSEMLGTTDKFAWDKIWYECEFIDVLRGATIVAFNPAVSPGFTSSILSQQLVSNGETVHKVRVLLGGGTANTEGSFYFRVTASDGSHITRRLKIRIKEP